MESKLIKCFILGMVFTGYASMPIAQNTGKAAYMCDALRPAAVQLRADADKLEKKANSVDDPGTKASLRKSANTKRTEANKHMAGCPR